MLAVPAPSSMRVSMGAGVPLRVAADNFRPYHIKIILCRPTCAVKQKPGGAARGKISLGHLATDDEASLDKSVHGVAVPFVVPSPFSFSSFSFLSVH